MDEFALIERYFASRAIARDDVRLGIGDDAAVTHPDKDADLVIATDTMVEGTHFPPATPARALGHRILAVNLSDLAAMGAEPLWCTLSLTLPEGSAQWVDAFSTGFTELAADHGVALVGGDTVRGPLSMTVTVHGRVAPGAAIRRSGAGPDQGIYVTGQTGRAAGGLAMLTAADAAPSSDSELVARFLYPVPRVREGRSLSRVAAAMIDVSDGLHLDLSCMLRASGVGAKLDVKALHPADEAIERFGHRKALDYALTGGDDYELVFTVPAEREADLARISAGWECGVTCIGRTQSDARIGWWDEGRVQVITEAAFRHF